MPKCKKRKGGLTKTGVQIGTAAYMSPEQIDTKNVDKLTDIYSLGVTLFYMSVGKSPYSCETNSYRIQEKIMREPFPRASDFYPAVSEKLQEIILKATQKKKSDRYQSCNEFLSKLKKITAQKVKNKTETKDIISNNTKSSSKGLSPRLKIIWTLVLLLIISILFYFSSDLQFNDTNSSEKVIADSSLNTNVKDISLNQKSVNTNAKETSLWRSVGKNKVKIIHDYTDYDGFSDFYQVAEKMNDDEKIKYIKIQYNLIEECIGNCNDGIGTLTTLDSIGYLKKVYDGQFANGELIKGKMYIYTSAPVFFGDGVNDYKFWSENKIRVPFWLVESFEGSFSRNPGYGLGKLVEGEWYRSSGKYGGVGLGSYSTNFQELLKGTFNYGHPKKVTRNWKEYIGYNDPKDYFQIGGKSSYFYKLK